jgi:dipeptidyl aminopeptidase/acylaminoacyl peptidase
MIWRITVVAAAWLATLASIAVAEPLPIRAFAQLPRIQQMALSPDGSRIATLSNLNGRNGIIITSLVNPQVPPVQIKAPNNGYELRWVKWANNDYLLAGLGTLYKRAYFDNEYRETRMLTISADGKTYINPVLARTEKVIGKLVEESNGFLSAVRQDDVIDWSPEDPDTVLVSIEEDQRTNNSTAVRKINVASGRYSYVMRGRRDIYRFQTDASGEVRLGFGATRTGDHIDNFIDYRKPDGTWIKYDKSLLLKPDYSLIEFTKDPQFAYVLGPVNGRRALLKWDMLSDSLAEILFQHEKLEVETIFWDDNSRTLYGVTLSDDSNVYLDSLWSRRMRALSAAIPEHGITLESTTLDNSKFIIRAESALEPGIFYLFDDTKKTLEIIDYAYAGLVPEKLSQRNYIQYKSRDGMMIEAVLTHPRNAPPSKPLPTVILPHGGPWAHDKLEFDWLAQFIADRGYLVLQPNFRGSTGYGKAWLDAGDRQWGLTMQDDLSDGLQYLVAKGLTDGRRVCIAGGSYGGYAALWGAVKNPDQYRCAVSLNGVSDVVSLLGEFNGGFKDEASSRRIGNIISGRDALRAISPINFAGTIKAPILLVHSKDDGRVDIRQSRRMADKLKAAGKAVEFIEVEKGEHFLENEASRVTFLTALEAFLAKHLAP